MEYSHEIRNWERFQHYKDRNPPWVKLHYELLSSETWVMLSDASRVLAIACILIASRHQGKIPASKQYVQRVAFLSKSPDYSELVTHGFLTVLDDSLADASNTLAECLRSVLGENTEEAGKKKRNQNTGSKNSIYREQACEVLAHLVKVTGKGYTNIKNIEACLKREKCSVEDCKAVIDYKWSEFGGTDFEKKVVNPTTLWRPSHFQNYLDEARAEKKSRDLFSERPVVIREDFSDWRQRLQDAFSERGVDGARDIISDAPESFTIGLRASLTSLMNRVR